MRSLQTAEILQVFCPCTVDCSVGFLARQCLQEMQIYSPGKGGREGAPVRNDRYSQGPVTIFVRKEYLNTHLSYSKSLLMTLSESELFTVDTSNDNHFPAPVIREVRP